MKIVFIGAGNVATHLAVNLRCCGFHISQVYSRTEESARALADRVDAAYTTDIAQLNRTADVYIYSVSDDAIPALASQVDIHRALHLHTSGSTPMSVFEGLAEHYGVLYPLQTFSKGREVDFSAVPLFIEGNSDDALNVIKGIASKLSEKIYVATSADRCRLHLSAVFVSNFVNHLYEIGSELAADAGFSFEVLRPLIEETTDKINTLTPYDAQTGPAVRNDRKIIDRHLQMLAGKRDLAEIYRALSDDIFSIHKK